MDWGLVCVWGFWVCTRVGGPGVWECLDIWGVSDGYVGASGGVWWVSRCLGVCVIFSLLTPISLHPSLTEQRNESPTPP